MPIELAVYVTERMGTTPLLNGGQHLLKSAGAEKATPEVQKLQPPLACEERARTPARK